jgi:hypothetical protein
MLVNRIAKGVGPNMPMLLIYVDDFLTVRDQASVDTSNLMNKLRLSDGTCLGL